MEVLNRRTLLCLVPAGVLAFVPMMGVVQADAPKADKPWEQIEKYLPKPPDGPQAPTSTRKWEPRPLHVDEHIPQSAGWLAAEGVAKGKFDRNDVRARYEYFKARERNGEFSEGFRRYMKQNQPKK